MDTIEYNGQIYTRRHSKWLDSGNLAVCEALQKTLNYRYLETVDISSYSLEELLAEGDKFNSSSSYQNAIRFYEKALADCDEETHNYILPRITSCYRKCNMPRKVIDLFADTKSKYGSGFLNTALLTSVAAAYCDLKEYENALKCCKWAYRKHGKMSSYLRRVLERIKKESGMGMI